MLSLKESCNLETHFLNALTCCNQETPPVWMMRQAGRSLPEYQALRKKYSLEEMFRNPELIYTVTRQPIDRYGVDAAILFADILHVPLSLGLDVSFPGKGGPVIAPQVTPATDCSNLCQSPMEEMLGFVREGIHLLKQDLKHPLIGFCGGPFTVVTYMMGSRSKRWLYTDPEFMKNLLQIVTDRSIEYLKMQITAGVNAVQIFDSWASVLSRAEFCMFAKPFLKQIVDAVDVPVIVFSRAAAQFITECIDINPSAISCDSSESLKDLREKVPRNIALQGNLDPEQLYASPYTIKKATIHMLKQMEGDPGYIVNLGHGVLPDTPVDHVQCFVDTVKGFLPRSHGRH